MKSLDIFILVFIGFGIYCMLNLKKDYAEYKKTKHYIDFKIYIRNLGVVIGSIILFFYELSRLLS
jgi:hypothetical protein